jgi:hypothetical protein
VRIHGHAADRVDHGAGSSLLAVPGMIVSLMAPMVVIRMGMDRAALGRLAVAGTTSAGSVIVGALVHGLLRFSA